MIVSYSKNSSSSFSCNRSYVGDEECSIEFGETNDGQMITTAGTILCFLGSQTLPTEAQFKEYRKEKHVLTNEVNI